MSEMIKPQGRGGGGGGGGVGGRLFSGSLPNSQLSCVIMRSISCWGGLNDLESLWDLLGKKSLVWWSRWLPPPAGLCTSGAGPACSLHRHPPAERRSLRHVQNRHRLPCERARLLRKEPRGGLERRAMWRPGPIWF